MFGAGDLVYECHVPVRWGQRRAGIRVAIGLIHRGSHAIASLWISKPLEFVFMREIHELVPGEDACIKRRTCVQVDGAIEGVIA